MTKYDIEECAKLHAVDFLIIDETDYLLVFLKAPYMPKNFIRDIDSMAPVGIYVRYFYGKGFIHWLAWKLRRVI